MQHRSTISLPLGLLLTSFACGGDDDDAAAGTELGPCVQQQFCAAGLRCVDQICVDPDQFGDTDADGGTTAVGGASVTGDSTAEATADGGATAGATAGDAPEIHCTHTADACLCGHSADYGPPGVACSEASVSAPARCCASGDWPAYGGCSCWTHTCRQLSSDTCYCGIGSPDPSDEPVGSCSAPPGGICCRDPDGTTCACWSGLGQCLEGDEPVESCSVESLDCGESTHVAACN